ncbi:MAG: HEPN domain-containing protein [bacterium]
MLIATGIEFPLTHDLEQLVEIAKSGGLAIPDNIFQIGALTPYAVETRYPGYWEKILRGAVNSSNNPVCRSGHGTCRRLAAAAN